MVVMLLADRWLLFYAAMLLADAAVIVAVVAG